MSDTRGVLETNALEKSYGSLTAVDSVSLSVDDGEIVGLIGPNGAGKTTLINVITGELSPDSGSVELHGEDITGMEPNEICRSGISKTAQIPRPLTHMSVLDNVVVASLYGTDNDVTVREARENAYEWLEFVGIRDMADKQAGLLTHAPGRRLELARALATQPAVLFLDEVMSGLSGEEIPQFQNLIEQIRSNLSISILWVEHLVKVVTESAEKIIVLNRGSKIAAGTPEEVMNNPAVQESYLGGR